MKNNSIVAMLCFVFLFAASSCSRQQAVSDNTESVAVSLPVEDTPRELTPLMERELRGCFDFFWNEWVSDPDSPTYGMTCGDYIGMDMPSPVVIEEQGYYFAAIVIGVERGWITRQQGYDRVLITLNSLRKLKNIKGFYYHFIDRDTGLRGWDDSHDVEL
ncbi:MAG: hypothetical protein ACYSQY_00290, partial [Planctomycetota bacterium]